MKSHKQFAEQLLADPEIKKEYDRLETEFSLLDELLKAKELSGLSQAEIARRMGTKAPAVSRMIAGVADNKHSPSIATLHKYAEACGMKLHVRITRK
jgi:DNA transposition AAA+ family ATPase